MADKLIINFQEYTQIVENLWKLLTYEPGLVCIRTYRHAFSNGTGAEGRLKVRIAEMRTSAGKMREQS